MGYTTTVLSPSNDRHNQICDELSHSQTCASMDNISSMVQVSLYNASVVGLCVFG